MPRIIPIQGSNIPTNVTPGIGQAIGQGLSQGVAPLLAQQNQFAIEEEKFRLAEEERRQKNEAIDMMLQKNKWRQQFEYDVRKNHDPADYLDVLDDGENKFNDDALRGKSVIFREAFLNADKINRANAMGVMGTAMQRDILDDEKASLMRQGDEAIEQYANDPSFSISGIDAVFDSFAANNIIPPDELASSREQAKALAINHRYDRMDPSTAIALVDEDPDAKKYLTHDQIEDIKREAISRQQLENSMFSIQNSTANTEIVRTLTPKFNRADLTAQQASAIVAESYEPGTLGYETGMSMVANMFPSSRVGKSGKLSEEQEIEVEAFKANFDSSLTTLTSTLDQMTSEGGALTHKDPRVRNTGLSQIDDIIDQVSRQMVISASAPMPYDKKLDIQVRGTAAIRKAYEKITGGTGETSVALEVLKRIDTVGVPGKGRTSFKSQADIAAYRIAMIQAVSNYQETTQSGDVVDAFTLAKDPNELMSVVSDIEGNALALVAFMNGEIGTREEIVKKMQEQANVANRGQSTPQQNILKIEGALRSGMASIDSMENAIEVVNAALPNATEDVKQAEAKRLYDISVTQSSPSVGATRQQVSGGEVGNRIDDIMSRTFGDVVKDVLSEPERFKEDQKKAYKYQPSYIDMLSKFGGIILDSLNEARITYGEMYPDEKLPGGNIFLSYDEQLKLMRGESIRD